MENNSIVKLAEALKAANIAATKAHMLTDSGTCNLDSPIISLPNWKEADVMKAAAMAGVEIDDKLTGWSKGWRFVRTATSGQGECRTKMVEAAARSLQANGWKASVFYM